MANGFTLHLCRRGDGFRAARAWAGCTQIVGHAPAIWAYMWAETWAIERIQNRGAV